MAGESRRTKAADRTTARFWRNRRGNLTVEFAFIAPVLVLLIMGTFEAGRLVVEQLRVASAAQAGVRYGAYDLGTATDADGIAAAARAQLGSAAAALSVSSRNFCICPDQTEVTCGTMCTGSGTAHRYVEVAVARDLGLLFSYPIAADAFRVASVKSLRIN